MLDWTQKTATQAEVMVLILGTLCVKHFLGLPSPTLRPEAAGHVYDYLWQRTQAGWRWRHSLFPISQPAQRARDCAPLVGISTNSRSLLQVSFYRENYRNYRGGQDLIESKGVNGNSRT